MIASYLRGNKILLISMVVIVQGIFFQGCTNRNDYPILDHNKLATQYYGEDAQWYMDNIPFFECSDKQIEQVYYYRWKMYKAHIRNVGNNNFVITEFINHVPWDRDPYCTINAATMHHIYEGRWLKDNRYMDGYINNMYQDGGDNRHYSESIADAAYARYLVNADSKFITGQLDSMKEKYDEWKDHWDSSKNLYYIPAMPDATEYTIASIDASGGKDGFDDGEAFRSTINSYMYGNAMAISHIAAMKGDTATSRKYFQRAASLKSNVEHDLWNDSLQHFTDRYKVDNKYVHYWNFIRGRELAGMIPWYFNLPADSPTYNAAWKHVTDTSQLLGRFGLRTNEPSYQFYFKQFVFFQGQRGSQWNGPSWPYQTSQVLTGMANFLNNYEQDVITASDYLKILRLFTQQHFLPNGKIDLVENYDPNLGGPIVYYYWSNHYNHSSYNNLVITGLCGIRPSEGDTLVINPLVDNSIRYFCLDDVLYHGHRLTVVYDKDGTKYNVGKGLTVFVDGVKKSLSQNRNKQEVVVGVVVVKNNSEKQPEDVALNILHTGYPLPLASVNSVPDTSLYQAIDGRIWYFPEITNSWTTIGSTSKSDWYSIDFGAAHEISNVKIYLFADNETFAAPDSISIEYKNGGQWQPVKVKEHNPVQPIGNTVNTIAFDKVKATAIRINFKHETKQVAVSEVECY
jgi:Mannosylglycerate hydrolase MGH1-like glycoside hydrolase domain/NedA-like, galactose-binding domain/Glycosyl hydrolase family 65, C-terminal domain